VLLNDSRPGATWTETSRRIFPDVFDPAWEARVRAVAERECGPRRGSANLLGYFPDNELNWYGKWPAGRGCSRQHPENCLSNCLLTWFLLRPNKTPGFAAAVAFLRARYGTLAALNGAWGMAAASWAGIGGAAPFPEPGTAAMRADADAFLFEAANRYHRVTSAAIRAAARARRGLSSAISFLLM
jgi:agarase